MTPIAPLITDFLRQYLPVERGYSPHTCENCGNKPPPTSEPGLPSAARSQCRSCS